MDGTYQDYLATVRRQEQRDRDRFMGVDAHGSEPAYSADTGAPLDEQLLWSSPYGSVQVWGSAAFSREALIFVEPLAAAPDATISLGVLKC